MNNLKVWPHLTIVAVVVAVLAGVGVALWMRNDRVASAEAVPNAARIQRVEGDVALNNTDAANAQADQWIAATANQPFSVGDRIYTRDNSRASLAFTGRNFARLNPNTSLDVLSLSDDRTQLALRDGSAVFDVGYLDDGDLFEVATPYGAVDFEQPGLYNVGIDNGQVLVSVLSGLAQVVGLGGSGQISKGEMLTLLGTTAADVILSQVDGRQAGADELEPEGLAEGAGEQDGTMREVGLEDIATQLAYANKVVFVPGYGLATAQAQHAVRELADARQPGQHAGRLVAMQRRLLVEAQRQVFVPLSTTKPGRLRLSNKPRLSSGLMNCLAAHRAAGASHHPNFSRAVEDQHPADGDPQRVPTTKAAAHARFPKVEDLDNFADDPCRRFVRPP